MSLFGVIRSSGKFFSLMRKFRYSNATVEIKSNIKKSVVGYPLNYFLEHEAKNFAQEKDLDKSLKIAILSKTIEKLKIDFDEEIFVLSFYRISSYLQEDEAMKSQLSAEMNLILKKNLHKLEKFSSCFTILYKNIKNSFTIENSLVEPLFQRCMNRIKLVYKFRDDGQMLASFFDLVNKMNQNNELKKELEVFIEENHQKISFDSILQILSIIVENKGEKHFLLKIFEDVDSCVMFYDFFHYFKLLRNFLKIEFNENSDTDLQEKLLEKIRSIIKGLNESFEKKIATNFEAEKLIENYNNLVIKEYYQDISLLLKIFVDLKSFGEIYRKNLQKKDQNYFPEVEFQKIFESEKYILSALGKKQFNECSLFYENFLKNTDQDECIQKFIKIVFK